MVLIALSPRGKPSDRVNASSPSGASPAVPRKDRPRPSWRRPVLGTAGLEGNFQGTTPASCTGRPVRSGKTLRSAGIDNVVRTSSSRRRGQRRITEHLMPRLRLGRRWPCLHLFVMRDCLIISACGLSSFSFSGIRRSKSAVRHKPVTRRVASREGMPHDHEGTPHDHDTKRRRTWLN